MLVQLISFSLYADELAVAGYFPKGCTSEQMESTILKLLENYYRKRQDYER